MGYRRQDGAFVDVVRRVPVERKSRSGVVYTHYIDLSASTSPYKQRLSDPWGRGIHMNKGHKMVVVWNKEGAKLWNELKELDKNIRNLKGKKHNNALARIIEIRKMLFKHDQPAPLSQIAHSRFIKGIRMPIQ